MSKRTSSAVTNGSLKEGGDVSTPGTSLPRPPLARATMSVC
ncbi:conserved hypothetical protein [Verticillium alfalfae VaMs.102]|uniref:Uncharacterized protein n=1 Tax=Verticillium alfalfae (strain VaMs.102 / ATCC MYA-4576 / FGSC 10136) TaxID=526221 RepID=C9SXT4_VERA1|nr:conserved hypothetical protein [Verticillium alfalfae VaMs.102]EEY23599.1 conserved hypothetical protein [Verticillium alfalfae VaMs.102]